MIIRYLVEMNFSFVLICGLILSCFCSRVTGLNEEISVNQSPNSITVNEGESAEISCCWTKTTFDFKVDWLKNEKKVSEESHVFQKSPLGNCTTLKITNITPNDTGEYVCQVTRDIPFLRQFNGNKTILTINYTEQSTKTPTTTESVYLTSSVVPVTTRVSSTITGLKEEISVNQSPNIITVNEGESAKISCCWTKITFDFKVNWLKNDKKVSEESQVFQKSPVGNCTTLKITNITQHDAGEYVCKVIQDIPFLREFNGIKTILTVIDNKEQSTNTTTTGIVTSGDQPPSIIGTPKPESSISSHLTLSLSLAAAVGLLTLCLIFTVCRMRNSCNNSDRVVIHQTPHSDGEEHENNESEELNSNSSRGSLQWYQVPVYWSYFDVQRDKEEADQSQAE